ncbi:MAG TPA: SRPBCC family protein [Gaiellales bacterium]|nr:SRPBCC family protein [Gaiellales bacterium]
MWKTEHTHESAASPAAIFALWADVEGWPAWDASLIATTLDGPFAAGTTGTLHPLGMPEPIAFTLTAVEDGAGFSDETRLGPLVLRFGHRVEPRPGGSRIVVAIEAEGPDAEQVGPAVAEDLPESVAALAAAALRAGQPA